MHNYIYIYIIYALYVCILYTLYIHYMYTDIYIYIYIYIIYIYIYIMYKYIKYIKYMYITKQLDSFIDSWKTSESLEETQCNS